MATASSDRMGAEGAVRARLIGYCDRPDPAHHDIGKVWRYSMLPRSLLRLDRAVARPRPTLFDADHRPEGTL